MGVPEEIPLKDSDFWPKFFVFICGNLQRSFIHTRVIPKIISDQKIYNGLKCSSFFKLIDIEIRAMFHAV